MRVADLSLIAAAMERLRATPPTELGGLAVERVDDLALGSADLPPTDGLRFHLADGARVVVRPSGTEPKLKCYLEVVVPVDAEAGVDAARISAAARLDALGARHRSRRWGSSAEPSDEPRPRRRATARDQGDDLGPGRLAAYLRGRARRPRASTARCRGAPGPR